MYAWADGRRYEGEYYLDKKHGKGVYRWADGRVYDGMWKNGKQDGEGKYTQKDGTVRVGIWKNGRRVRWTNSDQAEKDGQPNSAADKIEE